MTETAWLDLTNPSWIISELRSHGRIGALTVSDRKLRLLGCACCRLQAHELTDARSHAAIDATEQFADGLMTPSELKTAWESAWSACYAGPQIQTSGPTRACAWLAWHAEYASPTATKLSWASLQDLLTAVEQSLMNLGSSTLERPVWRDLLGNPFVPYPVVDQWPLTVFQLAESLYEGQDCRLPLSDAVEETGHVELAEHFRKQDWHPKGCWAMDLILGKS